MGNKSSRVIIKGGYEYSSESTDAVRLRIGNDFLRIECGGERLCLVSEIKQTVPDQHYTFYLNDVESHVDTTDGNTPILKSLRYRRLDGKMAYLCAKNVFRRRPFSMEVTLEDEDRVTENSIWDVEWLPGNNCIVKPYKFRKYCLASHDGKLCLERVSRGRRSRRCRFYHVNEASSCRYAGHLIFWSGYLNTA